ncbi:hypothetical protein PHYNN_186 [Pantoea phage Phynn]|nr:hypothetical protein PHYNN_186 [Pantoea phage Phynn]
MANKNPYYTEEQKNALLQGRKAQQPTRRTVSVSLDKDAMNQLKDINDNTLETAVGVLDVKEGIKSFEDRFKEKFANFSEQLNQDSPLAESSPDFVGPSRPVNMSDNSSSNIDNTVNVNQENPINDFYREHHEGIQAVLSAALSIIAKRPVDVPLPDPEPAPEEETVVDKGEKKARDREKDKNDKRWSKLFLDIKNNTSGILSRFIGYSLEAMAKFAKWTLILGSLVFAFDVLKLTISKWFNDILAEGKASKELFGSYFGNVKAIVDSIDKGLKNFDMNNLGQSLKDLFVEPFKLLGDTIKIAIVEGIGNLISALGDYTNSDTLKDAGTGMRVSAIRSKQNYNMDVTEDDMKLLKTQELVEQKKAEEDANNKTGEAAAAQALSGNYPTGYTPPFGEAGGFEQKNKITQIQRDAAERALAEEKRKREQLESEIQRMQNDPAYLKKATDEENARNRERLRKQKEAEVMKTAPAAVNTNPSEIDVANSIVDADSISDKDRKTMESILSSLEEKNNSNKLTDDEKTQFGDILQRWQDKISADHGTPSASIDPPPKPSTAPTQTAGASNVQVNKKTVNNTITNSVQRTTHKPLVAVS